MTGKAGTDNIGHLGDQHRFRLPVAKFQILDVVIPLATHAGRAEDKEEDREEAAHKSVHGTLDVGWSRRNSPQLILVSFGERCSFVKRPGRLVRMLHQPLDIAEMVHYSRLRQNY